MKTSELSGPALDWAVAKCEGHTPLYANSPAANLRNRLGNIYHLDELNYSTNWSQGGPLIEREEISLRIINNKWFAETTDGAFKQGETPLIAGMRCFVTAWLGDDVDIPKELTA